MRAPPERAPVAPSAVPEAGEPVGRTRIAALDGLRGIAVAAVLAFHAGWSGASGGFLGVSLFFTLSGNLITALLLDDEVAIGRFWARRARRLLPAATVTLVAVLLAARLGAFRNSDGVGGDAVASLLQIANWRFLVDGQSYADLFGDPSPLLHYWSLSIEEQWYLLLPLAVVGIRRLGGRRTAVGAVLAGVTVASVAAPWLFSMDLDRVYYGTDTRLAEITIGGVAAVVVASGTSHRWFEAGSAVVGRLAPLALGAMALAWVVVDRSDGVLARGGFALHAALAVVVIIAAATGQAAARPLGWGPLVSLGRISYALYLVHWPLWLWLDAETTGLSDPWLSIVRVTMALAAAVGLHHLIEMPILDGIRLSRPVHALGALAVGAAAVIVLSSTTPAATGTIDFDAALTDARPPGLAGATLDEIALSAETAAAGSPAPGPALPSLQRPDDAAPDTAGTAVEGSHDTGTEGPALELAPTGDLSLGQALDIVDATGTGFFRDGPAGGEARGTLVFDATDPAPRVIVFGDSAALMLGFGLVDWGRATGRAQVVDLGVVGCGLIRDGFRLEPQGTIDVGERCGDWAPAFASLADLLEPDLVMLHYGLWETVDRLVPGWDDWRAIGDPTFDALLADEIRAATRVFTERGVGVAWVNSPALAPDHLPDSNDPARVERLNDLVATTVTAEPGAMVIDLHGWFADRPGGPLDPTLRPDGVHVDHEGSAEVAAWLGPRLIRALERLG